MISAVIITKDCEDKIKACLESLLFADEIIVIDDYSTDRTAMLASNIGARVFRRNLSGDFAAQRNFGLSKAKSDWIVFVDSDEIITRDLKEEILSAIKNDRFCSYYIPRVDTIWDVNLKNGAAKTKSIRLVKKSTGHWERKVHEKWVSDGPVGTLKNHLVHKPHPNMDKFISNISLYFPLHTQENSNEGKKSNIGKIVLFPLLKFIVYFIFRKGFLDGIPGLIYSINMSFHSFLSWSELWLLQNQKKQ